ncbi:MAG: hydrolase, partial [Firmicutes bacterium]|nr:hydrolase [Bacillota bacterium]
MDRFTLKREDTILFVIDIQERLVPVMKYKDQVIKNTQVLLEGA